MYDVEGSTQTYATAFDAAAAYFGTSAVVHMALLNMWFCASDGRTVTIKEV